MNNKIKIIKKIRYKVVFNRSGRLNRQGEGLIQIECLQDKKRIYFSTHTYVKPENFCGGLIVGIENDNGLNYEIYKTKCDIERIELEYIKKDVKVTLSLLKEAVKDSLSPAARLSDFGKSVIENSDRDEKTKINYKTLFNNIEKFKKNVFITDIDYNFVVSYDKFLRNSNIMHNTRISRLRQLRALLNEAVKRDIIDNNPFVRFKIQGMIAKKGYVTKEQLEEVENLKLSGYEDVVRDTFLVGCYTGLRYSDIVTLKDDNLRDGWIVKEMVKTKKMVEIPYTKLFNNKLQNIINKYGYISKLTKTNWL